MSDQQIVIFLIAAKRYGVPIQQVQSIERMLEITAVPRTLPFVKGVVNLRGTITPVIDVRERFGMAAQDADEDSRIIVVAVGERVVGMIVDMVVDVATLDEAAIEAPPSVVGGVHAAYLRGVCTVDDELLVLLNLERILSDVEEQQLREVEKSVHG